MSSRFKSSSGSYGMVTRYDREILVKIPKSPEGEYRTNHVSNEGVFVLTESPLPVNQLITAFFIIPPLEHLQALCHVKYAVTKFQATPNTPAGMELAIFNMDQEERDRWLVFIESLEDERKEAITGGRPAVIDKGKPRDSSRGDASGKALPRKEEGRPASPYAPIKGPALARLEIMPRSVKTLVRLINEEILAGSATVATDQPVPTGSVVELSLVHPISGQIFSLQGIVSQLEIDEQDQSAVVTLQFDQTSASARRDLIRFSIIGKVD